MPRIDPLSLLDCLSVLLNPLGGIKTQEDVARIVSLMSKFSKKLVSKCVYVEILHATESKLLENYMVHGGWELVSQWILDAVATNNGPLLETLLSLTKKSWFPLEVLKINDCARSVNSLIAAAPNERVRSLAHEVVSHWKEIARMNDIKTAALETANQTQVEIKEEVEETIIDSNQVLTEEAVKLELSKEETEDVEEEEEEEEDVCDATSTSIEEDGPIAQPLGELPVYRLTMRDGKHVLAKVTTGPAIQPEFKTVEVEVPLVETLPVKDGPKGAARRKQDLKPKELHSAEDLEKRQQNQEKMAAKKKRADEERNKEKLFKEKQKKLKEKLAEREAKKLKEQKEKDEATLAQLKSTSQKVVLPKIPKKSKADDGDKKKDSLSEKKADSSRRSSTDDEKKKKPSKKESKSPVEDKFSSPVQPVKHKVKTFNSKFRSTGLEEEPPLPPPRGHSKKDLKEKPNLKRSPPPGGKEPVEKKSKLEDVVKKVNEKPKPKPGIQLLQESNFFMDALNATAKIEPRKRKRRVSSSKDDPPPSKERKTEKVASSPTLTKPVKFYTENQEGKDDDQDRNEDDSNLEARSPTPPAEITGEESSEKSELRPDGTKSVLVIHRPADRVKKTVRFKSDEELVSIQYFELDETERVNVTRMGGDMKVSDAAYERDMYMNAKKRDAQPEVIENIPWKLIKIDCSSPLAEPGKNSTEKLVQEEREKTVLQAIYFSPESIPDSPAEALLEEFSPTEPRTIPLDDVTGNTDNVKDYSFVPWVESKGFAPVATPAVAAPVAGSSGGGGGWRTGDGQILASSVPEPSTFQPQQGFNVGYETGNMMNPNFGYQSSNFNMPRPDFNNMNGMMNPNMMPPNGVPPPNFMPFPPGNNFNGPPPGNNFNGPPPGNWGPQGFRGRGFMRGGRGFFPPRGGLRTNMCKHHMRGFCRNGDSCHFKHQ